MVSGVDARSLAEVQGFYDRLVERTVPVSGCKEAELTKLLENTFRHVNIALVNEIAMFAGDLTIDVWETIDAARPSPSGSCAVYTGTGSAATAYPSTPATCRGAFGDGWASRSGSSSWPTTSTTTCPTTSYAASTSPSTANVGPSMAECRCSAWPTSATPETHESRRAGRGRAPPRLGAGVRAADPHIGDRGIDARVRRVEATPEEVAAADAVVLLVDHDAFDLASVERHARYVLDTRHVLQGRQVEHL